MSEDIVQSDISTLFATDPLKLTRSDRTKIIEYFRDNRAKYLAGQGRAVAPKVPKQQSKGPLPDIDLDSIEL